MKDNTNKKHKWKNGQSELLSKLFTIIFQKPLCLVPVKQTDKIRKKQSCILIRGEENIFTFLPLQPNRQTDAKNIYRIDGHM